ncbi:hypothetical protein EAX61_09265 [Dokdonia sinensis]|uniref:Uncharacterized protein n=1 Tax=Dokdonia sinensis TaxID=2479847 RepID=A0A3M0G2W6_9FLAO|nr:hypothetical protein [Dokdonia sinensis]RMB58487.1 hypothetical protein EAX61_09265 [Dokdonia sinensis]
MVYFELAPAGNKTGTFRILGEGHYSIIEDNDQMPLNYLLMSKHFRDKNSLSEIVRVGEFILLLLRGYSILIDANHEGFSPSLRGLYIDNKRETIESVNLDLNSIDDLLDQEECSYDNNGVINAAFKPGFFRDILIYAGSGWNLANISRINDELIAFVKAKGSRDRNFRSNEDFGRFQATANNKSIGGYDARHGSKYAGGKKYSKAPMNIEEASKYIINYLNAVLKEYYNFELPVIWKDEDINLDESFF